MESSDYSSRHAKPSSSTQRQLLSLKNFVPAQTYLLVVELDDALQLAIKGALQIVFVPALQRHRHLALQHVLALHICKHWCAEGDKL